MKRTTLYCLEEPKSPTAEAFRTVRTNIRYMREKHNFQTLHVTSALPKEGKTFIVSNLAVVMAQEGEKVLLIDCDLRKPSLNKVFNIPYQLGLTNLLTQKFEARTAIIPTEQTNLDYLPSGTISQNPSELLSTNSMTNLLEELKKHYDLILFDSAPVLPVTDSQILAKHADGVIVVVRAGKTLRQNLKKTKHLLEHVGANLIGTLFNYKKTEVTKYYG